MTKGLAVYVHYPFCKSKCPYCDFNSHVREKTDASAWHEAYLKELGYFFERTGRRNITSIFFGGGTPSLMEPATAGAIIEYIDEHWGLAKDAEITLEANPTSVEYQKFKDFRAAGINRVSVGVQSFDEAELKFLGREHSSNEAKTAIEYAAKIFPRYSFDLIYALPQQPLRKWRDDLKEALKLTRGHISLYQLTIEENTNFANQYRAGKFVMPENDMAAEFYEATQEICEAHGLPAYEISNHAAPGQESRHNLTYWRYGEYLGIGPGAHGRVNGHASVMKKSPEKWLEMVAREANGLEQWVELTEEEKFEERVMMGMRLKEGIKINDEAVLKNAKFMEGQGFVQLAGNIIKPTDKGLLMLNSVTAKLLGY